MRKLILITILALCALIGRTQTFDYQLKGWQLQTDTSYVEGDIPETIGTLFWDKENHTISVILENGVKGQMFQEIHIYGKNTSGAAISNGMAVSLTTNPAQFATFEKTDITSISSAKAFVGLATEDIGVNEFGYVTITGNVREISTTGLTEKNPVYVSTTPGLLTSTMPNAPNICILVGNCERAHATQGRINVNSSIMPRLQDLSDVNGTPLTTKGQIPVWDEANNYFDFDYNIWPDLISNEGYGSSWDGVDSVAPSKNAVYDKIQSLIISGGATNLSYTASATDGKVNSDTGTDATIPAGSTTNASLMLPADKTKLNGIASGADNYGSWTLNAGGFPTTVPSGYTVNFLAGTGLSVTNSGLDLTYTNTAPMVYPGAGIPLSTGSAWGTSITDNSSNWNTAYSNRIATFTTTGNSGAATFSGNTLNIPNYTLAGLGGVPEASTATLNFRIGGGSPSWAVYSGNVSQTTTYARIFLTTTNYWDLVPATSAYVGLMSGTDKSNLDGLVTDKGKVQTSGGTLAYLNDSYFTLLGGWKPTTESTPTYLSDKPFSSGGAYTQLLLKADLSGASFTGAISSTSTMTATDFILSSDRRLKTKIRPLKNTAWVRNIPFVSYQFKSDSTETTRYGVIAQDVESVNKNLVHTDEKGNLSVSYINLLIAKIADLEKRVSDLETQIKAKR